MSEKRFYLDEEDRLCIHYDGKILASVGFSEIEAEKIVDKLNEQQATIKKLQDLCGESDGENAKLRIENKKLKEENEQLRMKLKGDDYIMVSEMLSNLRKTGICDGCKNKDKPVEWYLERGFSITGRVCDRYEPEV